jgi:hypothetical protein
MQFTFSQLEFKPLEQEFNGRDNCLFAEFWNQEKTKGIRIIDDYSRNSLSDKKIYFTEKLIKDNGMLFVESIGYQFEFDIQDVVFFHLNSLS